MADTIYRSDAITAIKGLYNVLGVAGTKAAVMVLDGLPAADAVEVVRCGKCVHRSRRPNCAGRHPDWFCADGERKE